MENATNPPLSPREILLEEVRILAGPVALEGILGMPQGTGGIVLFAHGSGSSRFSPRNQLVAQELRAAGLATLLFDLLTPQEEQIDMVTMELRFDIGLLAERVISATDWILQDDRTQHLKMGYFGASTGTAAALIAASQRPEAVAAVVSRGGRPDLALSELPRVQAPTLLIVGGKDLPVIEMNRKALEYLHTEKELVIVPGATHLFEEPGTLEQVARHARDWFVRYLSRG